MTTAQVLILVAIAIYLLFMLWIGWICAKKNESVDDFYLGGRKLGPFVTAMSAEASDMSSWLLMGLPGVAYLTGLAEASWTAIGLVGNAMTSAGALENLADSETIIVRIASLISQYGPFAALLSGVILAGILAATMSTADSQLLAASSSVSQDLGNDFL